MKKKLLLIEDDLTLAELTADSLVSRGFDVDVCYDVRNKCSVPIIFVSSRNAIEDKTHALNIGGDDYLEKPYSIDVLEARINAF